MPGTPAELAAKYGVSVATISRWRGGKQNPSDPATLAQIEAEGGPAPHEWELTESKPVVAARPAGGPIEATAITVQAEANKLLQQVRDALAEAEAEDDIDRRVRIFSNGSNILRQLGRVVGAGHVVTERQILDSPHWRLLGERIVTALEPWPDALAAVATALEGTSAQLA